MPISIKSVYRIIIFMFIIMVTILSCNQLDNTNSAVKNALHIDETLLAGSATVVDQTVNAFALPIPGLSSQDELFFVGNSFFNQNWVQAPASTTARDGLGPFFNAKSCSGCHFKDGRGQPPASIGQLSEGFILRLSIPGKNAVGGPLGDPNYGNQFQEHSIEGVPNEGLFAISWEILFGKYPDGTSYELRKPKIDFNQLNYGEMSSNILISPRVAPQMIGLGLLEAIDEKTILAFADEHDKNNDGISGKPNYVWNAIEQKQSIGRFGWKANEASLMQQISGALNGDMGITSQYFNDQHVLPHQIDAKHAKQGGSPEIQNDDLQKLHLYASTLAVPARRNSDDENVLAGKQLFKSLNCNSCHIDKVTTGSHPTIAVLSNQTIMPYTDMLLHDMGDGLSDNRPDFLATGNEWRTPPLWGIGLFKTVNKHTFYLHDGRARNLEEAILWHGGEAEASKNNFMHLSTKERNQLLQFLNSL
jgi:CxxC motif-containing protein (DUF1111 family)